MEAFLNSHFCNIGGSGSGITIPKENLETIYENRILTINRSTWTASDIYSVTNSQDILPGCTGTYYQTKDRETVYASISDVTIEVGKFTINGERTYLDINFDFIAHRYYSSGSYEWRTTSDKNLAYHQCRQNLDGASYSIPGPITTIAVAPQSGTSDENPKIGIVVYSNSFGWTGDGFTLSKLYVRAKVSAYRIKGLS